MQIELYLVPPGNKDFRNTLVPKALEGIEGPDYSNILYLAPTHHMVKNWQREFHPHAGDCYMPPRGVTINALAKGLYASNGGGAIIDEKLSSFVIAGLTGHGIGFSKVLADFSSEIKNHFPGEDADSVKTRLEGIFAELFIPDEVTKRIYEALEVHARYADALKAAGTADGDDALVQAAAIAERQKGADVLIVDGFYEVTPAEGRLIRALISRAGRTVISIPISGAHDDLKHCYSHFITKEFGVEPHVLAAPEKEPGLSYVASQSQEDEVEGIARHIKSSFVSGRLRELDSVYVAFPKLSEYRELVDRVFTRYGIPYSPQAATRRPYSDILSLVEAARDGFPRLATARLLTSPYFRGIPEDIRKAAPAIALEAGNVRGRDSWLRELKARGLRKEGAELFDKITSLFTGNYYSYTSLVNKLLDIIRSLSFTVPGEESGSVERALRKLVVLDTVPRMNRPDPRRFAEVLGSYLDRMGPDGAEPAGVHVADLREIRGLEPEHLYLGGLKDGSLPARPEVDYLLPDSVRARLGLVDMHRYLKLQGYIFRRLVSSARHLRLSYPSMEGDKVFIPSLYLRGASETREQLYGDFSPEEAMTRLGWAPLSSGIKEISGVKGIQGSSPARVTDIDAYRSCPRRYFIEKVLGIEPSEIREYEVEPKTMGIILHEVMEKLIGPPIGSMEAFRHRAEKAIDKVLDGKDLDEYFKALIRESFLTVLPEIFEIEEGLASERYIPDKTEYSIKGEPLPGIKLKGKIDRIDVRDGGLALVLDYKSGSATLSSTGVLKRGETLQPFIYSALLKAEGARSPESVGIYSLKDLRIKRVPDKKDLKEGRTLEHFIETALLYLDSAVSAMRDGDFKAAPLSDATCRQCHERPYCPYIQGDAR